MRAQRQEHLRRAAMPFQLRDAQRKVARARDVDADHGIALACAEVESREIRMTHRRAVVDRLRHHRRGIDEGAEGRERRRADFYGDDQKSSPSHWRTCSCRSPWKSSRPPAAVMRPRLNTWIRSDMRTTRRTLWSMRRMPIPARANFSIHENTSSARAGARPMLG